MSQSKTSESEEYVLAAKIEHRRALERERQREQERVEELSELEERYKALVAQRKGHEAYAEGLSELTAGLLAIETKNREMDDKFIALVKALGEYAAAFDEREQTIVTLAKRANYVARMSAHRHVTPEQRAKNDAREFVMMIRHEMIDLWNEAGGLNDGLAPFPLSAFDNDRRLKKLARQLSIIILDKRGCYDPRPQLAALYLKQNAEPAFTL